MRALVFALLFWPTLIFAKSEEGLLKYKLTVIKPGAPTEIGMCEPNCRRIYWPDEENPKYILEYTAYYPGLREEIHAANPLQEKVATLVAHDEDFNENLFSEKREEFLRGYLGFLNFLDVVKKPKSTASLRKRLQGIRALDAILIAHGTAIQSAKGFSILFGVGAGANAAINVKETTPEQWSILLNIFTMMLNPEIRWDGVNTSAMWNALTKYIPSLRDYVAKFKFGAGPNIRTGFEFHLENGVLKITPITIIENADDAFPHVGISAGIGASFFLAVTTNQVSGSDIDSFALPATPVNVLRSENSSGFIINVGAGIGGAGSKGKAIIIRGKAFNSDPAGLMQDPVSYSAAWMIDYYIKTMEGFAEALGFKKNPSGNCEIKF